MHPLAQCVLSHIRRQELLRAGDRVGVAVSGGIDSVALLRLLLELRRELGIVLSVVHFNHKLRGAESEADQSFVAALAREYGLEFHVASGDVEQFAAEEHCGVEAAARELRHGFFGRLLGVHSGGLQIESDGPQGLKPASIVPPNGTAEAVPLQSPAPEAEAAPLQSSPTHSLDKIVTGHTLDDQAETVLMRLIRGTGLRGLGGIYPRIVVEHEDGEGHGEVVRPLLGIRRSELDRYLSDLKQPWREDASNSDSKFTRNRVRRLVIPLLEQEFNPAVVESLAELAEIARDEEDYWEGEISGWLGTVVQWAEAENPQGLVQIQLAPGSAKDPAKATSDASSREVPRFARDDIGGEAVGSGNALRISLSRPWLLTESRAVQRRVLKAVGERAGIPLEFKHIEEILRFAGEDGPSGKELSLPLGWRIVREPEAMVFVTPDLRRQQRLADYEYLLPVPGRAVVPELRGVIEALRVGPGREIAEYNPQQLLRSELLPGQLMLRNWRPGDRYWPAHTKSPKKVKELLQERHVSQPERWVWPVAVSGDEIVWMRGFPVPARLRASREQEAIWIREMPWAEDERTI